MRNKAQTAILILIFAVSTLTLTINVGVVQAYEGHIIIESDGTVSPETAPIQRIGNLYLVTDDINWDDGTAIIINKNNTVIDGQGHSLTGRISAGISLNRISNVTIKNFEIKNFHYGIYFHMECENNLIYNNKISNTIHGILFEYYCANNEISENTLTGNGVGINFDYNSNNYNKISRNNITSNGYGIMFAYNTYNNTVVENNIMNNDEYGIFVQGGQMHYFARNNLVANRIGILLTNFYMGSAGQYGKGCSQNNTIVENFIASNTEIGLYVINGSNSIFGYWYGGNLPNYIFHNVFDNNADHVCFQHSIRVYIDDETDFVFIMNSTNILDDGYPSGGNYWSDYSGVDADGDGIGDTTYVIDEFNEDKYPLMEPWSTSTMTKSLIRTIAFWNLPKGTQKSLTGKLSASLILIDRGKDDAALGMLTALIEQADALREKKLTIEQANQLISETQRIINQIQGQTSQTFWYSSHYQN